MLNQFPPEILTEILAYLEASVAYNYYGADKMYDNIVALLKCNNKQFNCKFEIAIRKVPIKFVSGAKQNKILNKYAQNIKHPYEDDIPCLSTLFTIVTELNVDSYWMLNLLPNFKFVTTLHFGYLDALSNFAQEDLPLLQNLSIKRVHTSWEASMNTFFNQKPFPNVTNLEIGYYCPYLKFETFPNLKKLIIEQTCVCDVLDLSFMINLEHLEIGGRTINLANTARHPHHVEGVRLNIGNLSLRTLKLKRFLVIDLIEENFSKMKYFNIAADYVRCQSFNDEVEFGKWMTSLISLVINDDDNRYSCFQGQLRYLTNLQHLHYNVTNIDNIANLPLYSLNTSLPNSCANVEKLQQIPTLRTLITGMYNYENMNVLIKLNLHKISITFKSYISEDNVLKLLSYSATIPDVYILLYFPCSVEKMFDAFVSSHKGILEQKIYGTVCRKIVLISSSKYVTLGPIQMHNIDQWIKLGYIDEMVFV
jgi:hypothetical protein